LAENQCIFDFGDSTANNIETPVDDTIYNIEFKYLTFQNCKNADGTIRLNKSVDCTIERCNFYYNTLDIFAEAYGSLKVLNNSCEEGGTFFKGNDGQGINHIQGNDVLKYTNYVFNGDTGTGMDQTVINGNSFFDNLESIFYGNFSYSYISNNLMSWTTETTSGSPVNIFSSLSVYIGGNYVNAEAGSHNPVNLELVRESTIVGNFFFGDSDNYPAVMLDNECDFNTISGNVIESNGDGSEGLQLNDESDYNSITGNYIVSLGGGTSYAVNIDDANCNNNVVVGNALYGGTGDVDDSGTNILITALIKHLLELGIIDADALNTVYNTVEVGAEKEVKKHRDNKIKSIKKIKKKMEKAKEPSFFLKKKTK
jgi:hypothetical protein